jgi:hypothetical protein
MKTLTWVDRRGRRNFIKQLALGGGALGAGLSLRANASAPERPASGDGVRRKQHGYRETAHVREYYAKASL